MKQGWNTVKLGDVLKRQFDSVQIDDLQKYKRITIKTKGQGIFLRDEVVGAEIGTKNQFKAKFNQFLLSKIDAMNGAFGIVPKDCDGGIITGNFWTFDFDESVLDRNYLNFLCIGGVFTDFSLKASEGTTNRKYLREDKFNNLDFPLPPLSEQQRIAGQLAALKGKIDEMRKLRGEQLREVERVETQFLNDIFDSLKQNIGTRPIEKVAILERGRFGYRPRNAPHLYENGTYPFIQTGEVSRAKGGKIEYSQTLNEEGLKVSRLFKPNTVLLTIAANIGNTAILDFEACFPDSVVSVRPKEDLDIYFLDYYLRGQKDYLNAIAPQSAQKNINVQILSTLKIPVPPLSEQRHIVSEIQAFQTKMEALKAAQAGQLLALEGLFPGVLKQAFRGEW